MEDTENIYIIPFKAYRVMKYLACIALPAIAVFYGVTAPYWGWPAPEAVVATINSVALLLGTLIGISQYTAVPVDRKEDE